MVSNDDKATSGDIKTMTTNVNNRKCSLYRPTLTKMSFQLKCMSSDLKLGGALTTPTPMHALKMANVITTKPLYRVNKDFELF